jgi:hypothetical protein
MLGFGAEFLAAPREAIRALEGDQRAHTRRRSRIRGPFVLRSQELGCSTGIGRKVDVEQARRGVETREDRLEWHDRGADATVERVRAARAASHEAVEDGGDVTGKKRRKRVRTP